MQKSRLAAVIALAGIVLLSGCTEIGSLSDKTQIGFAMEKLETELDDLAGISTEYTAELQGDFSYRVQVHSTAPQLSAEQLVDVALLVREQLSTGVLARTVAFFDLVHDDLSVLTMSQFGATESELRAAFERAAAVGEAYGSPATVNIDEAIGIGFSQAAPSPDWQAIRGIAAQSPPTEYWAFPGLSWQGAMPPPELTDLVDAIGAVVSLGFEPQLYVSVDWYGEMATVTVAAEGVDVADPAASPMWEQAVQVVALIGASELTGSSFMFYALDAQGTAIVSVGQCSETVPTGDGDAVLAAALIAAGVLASVEPGQCLKP